MDNDSVQRAQEQLEPLDRRADQSHPDWGSPARRSPSAAAPIGPAATGDPSSPSAPPSTPPPPTPASSGPTRPQRPRRAPLPVASGPAIAAVVVAALGLSFGFQTRPNSISIVLTTAVLTGLILAVPTRRRISVVAPVLLALGAAAVVTIRASVWVTAPTFGLLVCSVLIAAHDRLSSRGSVAKFFTDCIVDLVDSIRWMLRPLTRSGFVASRNGHVIRGLALAAAVGVPLLMLLASADAVFSELLSSGLVDGFWQHVGIAVAMMPVTAGVALRARRTDQAQSGQAGPKRRKSSSMVEATIVLTTVVVVLGSWGLTQIAVALGGADRLLATADLTAAENARQGYFQLMAVIAMVLAVVVVTDRLVARSTGNERMRFLVLSGLIGVETIGVAVATYSRLALYVQGFGHTMLRVAAVWMLAWMVAVLAVTIVAVNRWPNAGQPTPQPAEASGASGLSASGMPWLRSGLFVLTGLWILAFGVSNPEGFVAARNMERSAQAELDTIYLTERLGSDAVPTIVDRLPQTDPDLQGLLTAGLCRRADDHLIVEPAGWNRSLSRAESALDTLQCPS